MKYLVDTHTLLWYLNDDPQLPMLPKTCIENPANGISVSIASFWEITIKHAKVILLKFNLTILSMLG